MKITHTVTPKIKINLAKNVDLQVRQITELKVHDQSH